MSDLNKVEVNILCQKVFHDGTSMIVLKPGSGRVEERFIARLVEDGIIDKPEGWEPEPKPVPTNPVVADGMVFSAPPEAAAAAPVADEDAPIEDIVEGEVVDDAPLAGSGEAVQLEGGTDPAGEAVPPVVDKVTMVHVGFGKYAISGPGVPPDTVIQGKKDAQTYVDDMNAKAANEGSLGADEDAPIE